MRLYMYFLNFSTACIQLLKYVQVQIVVSDLPNLFYRCDLVNQLCLDILPPLPLVWCIFKYKIISIYLRNN